MPQSARLSEGGGVQSLFGQCPNRPGIFLSGASLSSSDSRDSSRGKSSNVHGGRGGDASVAGSIGGSVTSIAKSSVAGITSVAEAGIASTVAKEVGVSLSCGGRSQTDDSLGRGGYIFQR